ncbi:MAG: hypothetical protein KH828_04615 [Clostridiales bacterium]|nr:hypothetical protein [Clostridiales bacterium]
MLKLFIKNDGAISVFLSLILLPVLLLGCLTVDGARVYMSKTVVSDAGDMAMNAALAQYNMDLKEEYGLIAMDKNPESISGDLEKYFAASLNGTGIDGIADYDKLLDVMEESFEAINIEASKLYKTEVEKQQILEYMKYRAPVCMAEMVLEKLDMIKDTKKMMDAMEAEMDFSEAMEDCHDAFQEAKKALDDLDAKLEAFPSQDVIEQDLERAWQDYIGPMAKCFLLRAALSHYDDYDETAAATNTWETMKSAAENFKFHAEKVNMGELYRRDTYDNYISAMYYKNTIDTMGGIDKMLEKYDAANRDNDEERQTIVDLTTSYNQWKNTIAYYSTNLLNCANSYVNTHFAKLNGYYKSADATKNAADKAYKKLEEVKKKLDTAREKYNNWDAAAGQLEDPGAMEEELEEYANMFDTNDLETLMDKVNMDKVYMQKLKDVLNEEKFYNQSIASVPASSQSHKYMSEADYVVSPYSNADLDSFDEVEFKRTQTYITDYHHTTIPRDNGLVHIHDDPFYQQLIEFCKKNQTEESEEKRDEANGNLEEGALGGEEANSEEGYPTYNWGSAGVTLPTSLTGNASISPSGNMTGSGSGDIGDRSDRRDIISKTKESIKAASSFLDSVNKIVAKNLANLYIAEYGMQLFSYYTVDKKVEGSGSSKSIKTLSDGEAVGISGFPLSQHKAYRAETEYILWGNQSSAQNIKKTVGIIFGIRLLFNSFFAFTNKGINSQAHVLASAVAGGAPYLIPIIKIVYKLSLAMVETTSDIQKIKQGYGVTIIKDPKTWATYSLNAFGSSGDNTEGVTLDYSEYLRIFLNIAMLGGAEVGVLGRIADCIQVNMDGTSDITQMYTMVAVEAKVKTRTTFMRSIADWSGAGWGYEDSYSYTYQSILGY